jgi:ecotin
LASTLFQIVALAEESTNMEPYPAARDGFERMVFRVPAADDEAARKVEIIVGKILSVDCNRTSFGGLLSTRMACPPGTENVEAFVTVNGDGFLQRYNSKLPTVVYVPKGFEVRYRIWAAQQDIGQAESE